MSDFIRAPMVILLIVVCAAMTGLGLWVSNALSTADRPASGVMAATVTAPAPMATGTPSPSPTVDYQQVYPAQTQSLAAYNLAQAQERIAKAAYDLAQAQERIAQAAATLARATEQGYQAALLIGTPTAIARATAQAEKTAQAQAEQQAAYIQQETARIVAAIERDAQAERNRQNLIFYAWLGGGILVGAVIIARIYIAAYRAQVGLWNQAVERAISDPLGHLAPVRQEATLIPQSVDGGQSWRRIPPPPAHIADNPDWIVAALNGESVAIDVWEKSGKYDGNYRELYRWLANNNLIIWRNKMVLNEDGIKAVENHLPTADMFPENAPRPSVPYTESAENAGGGGGRIAKEG